MFNIFQCAPQQQYIYIYTYRQRGAINSHLLCCISAVFLNPTKVEHFRLLCGGALSDLTSILDLLNVSVEWESGQADHPNAFLHPSRTRPARVVRGFGGDRGVLCGAGDQRHGHCATASSESTGAGSADWENWDSHKARPLSGACFPLVGSNFLVVLSHDQLCYRKVSQPKQSGNHTLIASRLWMEMGGASKTLPEAYALSVDAIKVCCVVTPRFVAHM